MGYRAEKRSVLEGLGWTEFYLDGGWHPGGV